LKIPQLKVDNHETVTTSIKKGVHSYEEPQWHKKKLLLREKTQCRKCLSSSAFGHLYM